MRLGNAWITVDPRNWKTRDDMTINVGLGTDVGAGTSFSQVLADFRYALARKLLRSTDESIENIVYLTGFSEPSTFYRAFKRWVGETPVEFRKRGKG